jgi:methionyl-tRNA formyltransferase
MKLPQVIFMGTPQFAVPSLEALASMWPGCIQAIFTQPPRIKGRGNTSQKSPVHLKGEVLGIPIHTPPKLNAEAVQTIKILRPDLIIVAAYGHILPAPVLELAPLGCLNIHASLLPRWRGAAPIQHSIWSGDQETGVTLMEMEQGLDTGAMIAKRTCPIFPETTGPDLTNTLAVLGAQTLQDDLPDYISGALKAIPQPQEGVTYASKIAAKDFLIDWSQEASLIERQIRALFPHAYFMHQGKRFKVLQATLEKAEGVNPPGTLLDEELGVACKVGAGCLRPQVLVPEGKKAMPLQAFLNGYGKLFPKGMILN